MSKGGLQSRQQLPCRAGSFLIRVSETQEDQAIVYRDSKEFITHRYRHRPIRSAVPLFPGGRNKGGGGGSSILEQKPGQTPVLLAVVWEDQERRELSCGQEGYAKRDKQNRQKACRYAEDRGREERRKACACTSVGGACWQDRFSSSHVRPI